MSMRVLLLAFAMAAAFALSGCTKTGPTADDRPRATVMMRDGTSVTGSVVSSSPSEITIAGDDGKTQSIPMKQVQRVDYGDAAAPAAASGVPSPAQTDAAHESHYHPARTAINTKTYTLGAGTEIAVRNEETIDSAVAAPGQTYAAEVTRDVLDANGAVVVPRGSNAQILIKSASRGGRIRGASDLVLDLASVSVEGQRYSLSTEDIGEQGRQGIGKNRRTAEFSGGGAVVGAIIGAIAGGGKGAAIGAGSGAGAGALTQILTKGGSIRVPAETVLTFRLDAPLRVVEAK